MDNDQFNGGMESPVGGMPEMPTPDDPDLKISGGGTKIAAIVIAVLAVGAIVGFLIYKQGKDAELAKYEELKDAFDAAHTAGYVEFWKSLQIDLTGVTDNQLFQAKVSVNTAADPVRYAKHVREKSLFVLDKALPKYEGITPLPGFEDKVRAVKDAIKGIRNSWEAFSEEQLKFEDYFSAKDKLETASSHWLGLQQNADSDKFLLNGMRYVKLLNCLFQGKKPDDMIFDSMETMVTDTCAKADEKPDWFRRVAFECIPMLSKAPGDPDDVFKAWLAKSKEVNDTTS